MSDEELRGLIFDTVKEYGLKDNGFDIDINDDVIKMLWAIAKQYHEANQ